MEEDATQSRSLAQKLHAAREKIDGKLHDDTTLVILDFAVYLFCFGGLAVTVTVWSILVANQPTTSSFSGIVVPHIDLPTGLPYYKFYWKSEVSGSQRLHISLESLSDERHAFSGATWWDGVTDNTRLLDLPGSRTAVSRPHRRERLSEEGHIVSQTSGGLQQTDFGFVLEFTKHVFKEDSLSNYFKLTQESFPLLMMNPFTIYVKASQDKAPVMFEPRVDHFKNLYQLLQDLVGGGSGGLHPGGPADCKVWPPGMGTNASPPLVVVPPPTSCPWEA